MIDDGQIIRTGVDGQDAIERQGRMSAIASADVTIAGLTGDMADQHSFPLPVMVGMKSPLCCVAQAALCWAPCRAQPCMQVWVLQVRVARKEKQVWVSQIRVASEEIVCCAGSWCASMFRLRELQVGVQDMQCAHREISLFVVSMQLL